MLKNREPWIAAMLGKDIEGDFSDDPDDPGGPTMHGVTAKVWGQWKGFKDAAGNIRVATAEEVKRCTLDDAKAIAAAWYWEPQRCSELPGGIDVMVADMSYNSGGMNAGETLQRALVSLGREIKLDGWVGENTIAACRSIGDTAVLVEAFDRERRSFLRGLKTYPKHGGGWEKRCTLIKSLALGLVESNVVEAKAPKAAIKGGFIAALGASLPAVVSYLMSSAPDVVDKTQQAYQHAHDAVAAGHGLTADEWQAIGVALATLVGAGVSFYDRMRRFYHAKSSTK